MAAFSRSALEDFSLANKIYAGATVTAFTVDGAGNPTLVTAPLYQDLTTSGRLLNPQTLDATGKWQQPVYIDTAVVLKVTGLANIADHQTGVISANLAGNAATQAASSAAAATASLGTVAGFLSSFRSLYVRAKKLIPAVGGNGLKYVRVNTGGTALEYRTAAQTRTDIGLGTAAVQDIATQAQLDAATANKVASADLLVGRLAHGQCRLTKSGANLLLSPLNGGKLIINSQIAAVPDAGVTLAIGAAAASTLYYIYAFMNAGVMTLEFSATGHATQAGTGVEIKSGDATRTLVGMARTTAAPAWADTDAQRFVVSWFNRANKRFLNTPANAVVSAALATPAELDSTKRGEFLTWSDESVTATGSVPSGQNSAQGGVGYCGVGFDGTTPELMVGSGGAYVGTAIVGPPSCTVHKGGLAEGYHYATLLVAAFAGTFSPSGSGAQVAQIAGTIRG